MFQGKPYCDARSVGEDSSLSIEADPDRREKGAVYGYPVVASLFVAGIKAKLRALIDQPIPPVDELPIEFGASLEAGVTPLGYGAGSRTDAFTRFRSDPVLGPGI